MRDNMVERKRTPSFKESLKAAREEYERCLRKLLEHVENELKGSAYAAPSSTDTPIVLAKVQRDGHTYALLRIPVSPCKDLTNREREIALFVIEGHQNKDIAKRLGISSATVAAHVRNIFSKFKVRTRTELASRGFDMMIS